MTEFTVPDCLVFKFEEIDVDTDKLDTTIYVLYDKKDHQYLVRGQRRVTSRHNSCSYSFVCEYAHELADFLQYIICEDNTVNEILYNYDNLPCDSNDLTFEFLSEYDDRDYEISGYDGQKMTRKRLLRNLRMLRNVNNVY
jgi:hypothetical protein